MKLLRDYQLKDIIISEDFKGTQPNNKKIEKVEQDYLQTGALPVNIVINDDNVLIDGYITYLLAVKYGIQQVGIYQGYIEMIEAAHCASSKKSYTWRVPISLTGKIMPGDRVLVPNVAGARTVKVERVIRQQYPDQKLRRKPVFKKC